MHQCGNFGTLLCLINLTEFRNEGETYFNSTQTEFYGLIKINLFIY